MTFDYIIVGAGSAGCVLANRLSANGKHSVLLLEAGPKDSNIWIHVPLGYGKLFKEKSVNWMYQTEPEPELKGRQVFQPRGKTLGGSSSINGLLYVRGQHEDYDRWRQLGNTGWGYDDVLPYFKKAENQSRGADEFHGTGGPLPVSNMVVTDPLSKAFIDAAVETGLPYNPDFNSGNQAGCGLYQVTMRNGRRCSGIGFFGGGEGENKFCSLISPGAIGSDDSLMRLDQGLADRKAETKSSQLGAGGLLEGVENFRQRLRFDSETSIGNFNAQLPGRIVTG